MEVKHWKCLKYRSPTFHVGQTAKGFLRALHIVLSQSFSEKLSKSPTALTTCIPSLKMAIAVTFFFITHFFISLGRGRPTLYVPIEMRRSKYILQLNAEVGPGAYAQLCIGSSRAWEQPSAQLFIVGWLLCTCATTCIASNHPLS
jgi:hypothetical protein